MDKIIKQTPALITTELTPAQEFTARLRKALAEGATWDARGLALGAADRIDKMDREHLALGKLADDTADELATARWDALEEAAKLMETRVETVTPARTVADDEGFLRTEGPTRTIPFWSPADAATAIRALKQLSETKPKKDTAP